MKSRLWVIEWQFKSGEWDICEADLGIESIGTNFNVIHKNKDKIQKILKRDYCKHWTKKRFRVVEYIAKG